MPPTLLYNLLAHTFVVSAVSKEKTAAHLSAVQTTAKQYILFVNSVLQADQQINILGAQIYSENKSASSRALLHI